MTGKYLVVGHQAIKVNYHRGYYDSTYGGDHEIESYSDIKSVVSHVARLLAHDTGCYERTYEVWVYKYDVHTDFELHFNEDILKEDRYGKKWYEDMPWFGEDELECSMRLDDLPKAEAKRIIAINHEWIKDCKEIVQKVHVKIEELLSERKKEAKRKRNNELAKSRRDRKKNDLKKLQQLKEQYE